jgi:predicted RNA binding protein YcfA (HicA-like mRNA interferase family)
MPRETLKLIVISGGGDKTLYTMVIGGYHNLMDSKTLIKRLEGEGWQLVRVKGSHHHFKHPDHPCERVTLKHPDKDIPVGTLHNIEKQAGWR